MRPTTPVLILRLTKWEVCSQISAMVYSLFPREKSLYCVTKQTDKEQILINSDFNLRTNPKGWIKSVHKGLLSVGRTLTYLPLEGIWLGLCSLGDGMNSLTLVLKAAMLQWFCEKRMVCKYHSKDQLQKVCALSQLYPLQHIVISSHSSLLSYSLTKPQAVIGENN